MSVQRQEAFFSGKPFYNLLLVFTLLQSVAFSQTQENKKDLIQSATWIADNGNGTFSNPLFFDEFSDPDLIRVADDYYLTGTTMHAMPGLPVLHSRDLVNWEFLCYAMDKLDLGPEFRLENGKNIYGRGIWAPCFRYNKGRFYIFSDVNGKTTQLFTATNPKGPWKHSQMKKSFHDLSVLFDDDGKVYIVWGYDEIRMAELDEDLSDIRPGTEKVIVTQGSGAGEGAHFYKIDGKYYITSTNFDPVCYQVCLRSNNPYGPYEIRVISAEETLGVGTGWRLLNEKSEAPFKLVPPNVNYVGRMPLHQGGIVQIQSGDWWAWSMMDYNSLGRLTCLSPVTWKDGWPFLGLEGNLTRSPRTWIKPNTGFTSKPQATYSRSDDFSSTVLQPVWQWNHVPVSNKWSLTKRKGYLRLNSLPANDFWNARNTLTQRCIGPMSIASAEMELKGLIDGDFAGLGLLNMPYGWIGVSKTKEGFEVQQFDQQRNKLVSEKLTGKKIWLRANCDFESEKAILSYSTDGLNYKPLGEEFIMVFQGRTFQGVRFGLFNYNTQGKEGGCADFNSFIVNEPRPRGLTKPIPYGKIITLSSLADSTILVNWKNFLRPVMKSAGVTQNAKFKVIDKGNGRIALQSVTNGGWVTVIGSGGMAEVRIEKEEQGDASLFQWQDMLKGDMMLMSLSTHKYLFADPYQKSLCSANAPGARPDRKDGSCFFWQVIE